MATLRTDDFEFFAVVYCDVVAKGMTEGDVMTAIQAKFLAIQGPLQNVSQQFRALVSFFVFICHSCLQNKESPTTFR
jgi:hypothetical protein